MLRIASGVSNATPEGLIRDLRPMQRQIRATLPELARRGITSKSAARAATRALRSALRREWSDSRLRARLQQRGSQVLRAADRDWRPLLGRLDSRRVDAPLVPTGESLLRGWVSDNVSVIASIRDDVAGGLERDLLHAIANDWTADRLAASWRTRKIPLLFGTLEGRTKVIAHTELRKLRANIQRERSSAVGVTHWRWETKGDSLVRDEHEELDGQVFPWDEPPEEGIAGTPPNCRCEAVSVVPDSLLKELGIRSPGAVAA